MRRACPQLDGGNSAGGLGGPTYGGPVIRSARAVEGGVETTSADGAVERWSAEWLRDNCRCDACRIVQTDERRWQPWLDDGPPAIERVDVGDEMFEVHWASGHRSTFTGGELTALVAASRRGAHATRSWRAGDELDRFDHDAVVTNAVARRAMFESFLRDGAVVVSSSP